MRVGVVTHYWLPHRGGIEVLAREQSERLARRGHEVQVVTSAIGARPGVAREGTPAAPFSVRRHRAWDVLGRRGVPWPVPSAALVRDWVRLARESDVVLVHGCTYAHSPVVIEAARRAGTPVLLLQHNPHVTYPGVVDWIERVVDRTLGRSCCARASQVAAVSEFTAAHVRSIAPGIAPPVVIPNAVDHDRFRPPTAEQRAHARRSLGLDGPVVLTVRRLVPRNGIDWAIRSWIDSGLDDSGTFLVIGDGLQRSELEHMAAGHRIVFGGAVSDAELVWAFQAADVFVMPTRSGEGFGLAAAEAMSAGLPVVASRGGALDEVVVDEVTGHLVATDDAIGFGRVVRELLRDPVRSARLGAAARSRVEEHFTWDRCTDELEQALLRLGASGGRRSTMPAADAA